MKPGASAARTGSRSIARATSVAASSVASAVRSPATISTRRMSGGGLKKCMPHTRSGSGTSAAISETGIDEVLVARIASGPHVSSEMGEELSLEVEVLGRGLDHQVAAGQPFESRVGLERARGLGRVPGAPQALARALGERGLQAVGARRERLRVGIVEDDLEAPKTAELSDPGAHRPGAHDPQALDRHLPSKSGLRLSRNADMPSTLSSVAIASSYRRRS